jgi:hypothetical protein
VIGWLSSTSRDTEEALRLPDFRLGLNERAIPKVATLRSNIAGQKMVPPQRAFEIAVAGGHHLLKKKHCDRRCVKWLTGGVSAEA